MSEFKLDIDAGAWLDKEGCVTTVFIGDACEPVVEISTTWEELVDQEYEAHKIGDTNRLHPDAKEFLDAITKAAEYARMRYAELGGEA